MYKILILATLFFIGCSNVTITGEMCNKLQNTPGAIVPQECRVYSEKEADKAFNKVVNEKKISDADLEFHKEK